MLKQVCAQQCSNDSCSAMLRKIRAQRCSYSGCAAQPCSSLFLTLTTRIADLYFLHLVKLDLTSSWLFAVSVSSRDDNDFSGQKCPFQEEPKIKLDFLSPCHHERPLTKMPIPKVFGKLFPYKCSPRGNCGRTSYKFFPVNYFQDRRCEIYRRYNLSNYRKG